MPKVIKLVEEIDWQEGRFGMSGFISRKQAFRIIKFYNLQKVDPNSRLSGDEVWKHAHRDITVVGRRTAYTVFVGDPKEAPDVERAAR